MTKDEQAKTRAEIFSKSVLSDPFAEFYTLQAFVSTIRTRSEGIKFNKGSIRVFGKLHAEICAEGRCSISTKTGKVVISGACVPSIVEDIVTLIVSRRNIGEYREMMYVLSLIISPKLQVFSRKKNKLNRQTYSIDKIIIPGCYEITFCEGDRTINFLSLSKDIVSAIVEMDKDDTESKLLELITSPASKETKFDVIAYSGFKSFQISIKCLDASQPTLLNSSSTTVVTLSDKGEFIPVSGSGLDTLFKEMESNSKGSWHSVLGQCVKNRTSTLYEQPMWNYFVSELVGKIQGHGSVVERNQADHVLIIDGHNVFCFSIDDELFNETFCRSIRVTAPRSQKYNGADGKSIYQLCMKLTRSKALKSFFAEASALAYQEMKAISQVHDAVMNLGKSDAEVINTRERPFYPKNVSKENSSNSAYMRHKLTSVPV